MKQLYSLIMLAVAAMLVVSVPAKADDFGVNDITMSLCKERYNTRSDNPYGEEWIHYSVKNRNDGYYIFIAHENKIFTCGTEAAECSATLEGDVITIHECEKENNFPLDCLCPYDLTFSVGPLQEGEYSLVFYSTGKVEIKVDVKDGTFGSVSVDEYLSDIEVVVNQGSETDIIYDMNGNRYDSFPCPGTYILNGKKIIWKGE